jgi:hypothetical protein
MRYCDGCGGVGNSKLTVPGLTPERPIELFYCDEECRAALVRRHITPDTRLQLVADAARSVS